MTSASVDGVCMCSKIKRPSELYITMNVYLSPLVHDSVHVKCVYKSAKVISESSRPPGGGLINLVSFTAARKHGAELQLCSAQSSIAHRAKGTHGSSKDATLLIACLCPCVCVRV